MNIMDIVLPLTILGGLGLGFGILLNFVGIYFQVEGDELVEEIREALPGVNCGGCGFAGCDSFAEAVANGEAQANGCAPGGAETAEKIAKILGVSVDVKEKQIAFIKCSGNREKSEIRYEYEGLNDCYSATHLAGGGPKSCIYGCLGLGSCKDVCKFNAINIVDGIAVIDPEKCTACGMCISKCPKSLIELIPYNKEKAHVNCNSKDSGKDVRGKCSVGCIACKICERNCEFDAIHVIDGIAVVDYDKCTSCNNCIEKCPTGAISSFVKSK